MYVIFDVAARPEYLSGIFSQRNENGEGIEKCWGIKADTLDELDEKIGTDMDNSNHAALDIYSGLF